MDAPVPVLPADWQAPTGVHALTTLRFGAGGSVAPFDQFNMGNRYAAEGDDVELTVSAGAAAVTGDPADRALFGQYNGLRDDDFYGLLGFGYSRINAASALRAEFSGSNLLLGTRELSLAWVRQGNWGLRLDYGELVRRDPYTVNSGMAGFGSAAPVVNYLPGGAMAAQAA